MTSMPSPPITNEIGAVLFDYGMVLTTAPHPPAWQRMKDLLGAGEDTFHVTYWRWRSEYDRGTLSGEAYWHKVAGDLGRTVDAATVHTLIQADTELWTQPNDSMIRWASGLQAAGIPTGILSNLGDAMEAGVTARFPWVSNFHHLTFSHRLGTAKPDPDIYQHAADGLGVQPGQVLFIDDREENIRAARDAGMHAIRYTDHASFERAMRDAGWDYLLAYATKV
jgi:putative hydrolase of the HAD superfamily